MKIGIKTEMDNFKGRALTILNNYVFKITMCMHIICQFSCLKPQYIVVVFGNYLSGIYPVKRMSSYECLVSSFGIIN